MASTESLVQDIATELLRRKERLATAESCTGGRIGGVLTDLAGSSAWFERGFITYSNEAKTELLGVPADLIARHGAVAESVAQAMASGALAHSHADWSIAVTGIAGPTGGSTDKPVGTVWFGFAGPDGWQRSERQCFSGDRAEVRAQTVQHALQVLLDALLGKAL